MDLLERFVTTHYPLPFGSFPRHGRDTAPVVFLCARPPGIEDAARRALF